MRHWKWMAGACIVLGVAAGGLSVKASAKTAVQTAVAERGRLDCKLELNGKVESLREKTYFAGIPGRIGSVMVREGDFVKKGDLLITYDEGELSKDLALTELDAAADMGRYDDSAQAGERMEELCGEAGRSIAELDRQINDTEVVLMLNRKLLAERQGGFAARDAALQADLACCTGGEDEELTDYREAAKGTTGVVSAGMKAVACLIAALTILIVAFVESLIIRAQITREWRNLGISKALGFTSAQLIRQIMLSNMPAIALGIAIGLALAPSAGAGLMKAVFSIFGFRKAVFTVLPASFVITAGLITGIAMAAAAMLGCRIKTLDPVNMVTEE